MENKNLHDLNVAPSTC